MGMVADVRGAFEDETATRDLLEERSLNCTDDAALLSIRYISLVECNASSAEAVSFFFSFLSFSLCYLRKNSEVGEKNTSERVDQSLTAVFFFLCFLFCFYSE